MAGRQKNSKAFFEEKVWCAKIFSRKTLPDKNSTLTTARKERYFRNFQKKIFEMKEKDIIQENKRLQKFMRYGKERE